MAKLAESLLGVKDIGKVPNRKVAKSRIVLLFVVVVVVVVVLILVLDKSFALA